MQLPTWQATIPELVPRSQLAAATRLEMVGVNVARAVGPALAGVIIASFGVPVVFALTALSVIFLAIALLRWRPRAAGSEARRERFVPALRAGGRYAWHEPVVRRILLRVVLFIPAGVALCGIAPTDRQSALGPGSRRLRRAFGALGAGAILAALVLGRVRDRLSTSGLLTASGVLFAAALALIVLIPNFWGAMAVLVFAGLA